MVRIQVNGGSLFINPEQSLHLPLQNFLPNCTVEHASIPAKSIHSIVMDVYNNLDKFDIFVLNFTYSERFSLWLEDYKIEMSIGRIIDGMLPLPKFEQNADFLENKIKEFTHMYYKYFANIGYNVKYSKMLIDSCISLLEQHNKKYILSSCQDWKNLVNENNQFWFHNPKISIYQMQLLKQRVDNNGHLENKYLEDLAKNIFEFGQNKNLW